MARQESRKRNKAKLVRALTLTSVMVLMAASRPAYAGFEWTPPPAPPPQEQLAPPVAAAPAASVEAERLDGGDEAPVLDPFPLERDVMTPMAPPEDDFADDEAMASSAPAPAPVTATPVIPFMKAPARVAPAPQNVFAPAPPPPAAKTVYETVDGFGRDIPLVLAMRQIVPPDYSYAFDPDINPGARISWNGGKPWNEVIEDAVRPGDMRVEIIGNTVRVRQTWDVAEDAMQTAATAPKPVAAPSPMPLMQPARPVPPMAAMPAPMQAEEMMPPQSYPRRVKPEMVVSQVDAGFVMPHTSAGAMPTGDDIFAPTPLTPAPYAAAPPAAVAPPVNPAPTPLTPSMAAAPVMAPPGTVSSATGPAILDPHSIGFWQAEQGASLKEVLGRWSSAAGVAMLWNSAYDYVLPAPMRLHATFPDAVTQILMGYGAMDPRPVGKLHPNLPHGPSVLVVENYSTATN